MEFVKELPFLTELVFLGNPLEEEATDEGNYNYKVINYLLSLKKLDGYPVIREGGEEEEIYEVDSDESSELDEDLFNDPTTQEIIKTLVL